MQPKVNLNLILWLSFSMFSLLIIVLFSVVQNVMINQTAKEQMQREVREAGFLLKQTFTDNKLPDYSMDFYRPVHSIASRYNVNVYIFNENGEVEYPLETQSEDYADLFESVKDKAECAVGEVLFQTKEGRQAYASHFTVVGQTYYLYLTSSANTFQEFSHNMRWLSIITALFSIAIAFVTSGFVSMVITKPLSEVTDRAKELAHGNYEVEFGGDFYCTEVAELSEALSHAGSEISKADKMQKELIANVSHDFKTPLTMIKAYAAMIQEISGDDPEKRQKHTQVIIDEADRLTLLVGDLLDLSKMQAGIESFEKTVFNLSEEVYLVAGRFSYLTETQGFRFLIEIEDDLYAYGSKERIEQVLYNLIGNAVNYTGEDKRVFIRLKSEAGGARFEVIDTGKGIASDEIDTIWERYYRSSQSHKRPIQGTGLGLSIVKTILSKHDFPFGVYSELGRGSCFWVQFPAPPQTEEEA